MLCNPAGLLRFQVQKFSCSVLKTFNLGMGNMLLFLIYLEKKIPHGKNMSFYDNTDKLAGNLSQFMALVARMKRKKEFELCSN